MWKTKAQQYGNRKGKPTRDTVLVAVEQWQPPIEDEEVGFPIISEEQEQTASPSLAEEGNDKDEGMIFPSYSE